MINKIYCGDSVEIMKSMPDNYVDLVITSPPYDDLRDYDGFHFEFPPTAHQLFRIMKEGGVVVWVIGDKTVDGSETGNAFKQALYFKEIGFNLHDTMIYFRHSPYPSNVRYNQSFEYMFVFSKGKPKTFNQHVRQKKVTKHSRKSLENNTFRQKDGTVARPDANALKRLSLAQTKELRLADNIWYISAGYLKSTTDKIAFKHPAIFPESLAEDHILSWSNPGDVILDCFAGSGTTGIMAFKNNRNFLLSEISDEYCKIAKERFKIRFDKNIQIERYNGKR